LDPFFFCFPIIGVHPFSFWVARLASTEKIAWDLLPLNSVHSPDGTVALDDVTVAQWLSTVRKGRSYHAKILAKRKGFANPCFDVTRKAKNLAKHFLPKFVAHNLDKGGNNLQNPRFVICVGYEHHSLRIAR
jgi:hypothetical protein